MNIEEWVENNTIHKIVAGSHLYGTARPDSDIDIRGVCLGPPETLIGLSEFKQYQGSKNEDTCIYELRRFCSLALQANPNILDILFAPPDAWLIHDGRWRLIYDNRHAFLSEKVRYTFSGYAISQLKRMGRHRAWLVDPPDHKPTQDEYGATWDGSTWQFPKIAREKEYRSANEKWKNYQKWLENRNPARAQMERESGFDRKYACHLARLLLQAANILRDGDYNPILESTDRNVVCWVLEGVFDYSIIIDWAHTMDEMIMSLNTELPKTPDRNHIEQLCMQIYLEELRGGQA